MCQSKRHEQHLCCSGAEGNTGGTIYVECGKCGVKTRDPEMVCHPESPAVGWLGDGVLH